MPASEDEWKATSEEFEKNWNFNHCLGAIDGKHIDITKPQESGSYYFNYKHNFNIVLMAVCNANYEFLMVDIGSNGRVSDGEVFSNTLFCEHLQENKLKLPKPDYLPGINCKLPYIFVADDAFPLSDNLMKPYSQRNLIKEKRIFNYRLSRARRVIENSFGILSSRFRILLKTINLSPEKATIIVRACCHLHNYLRRKKMDIFWQESFDTENILTGKVEPGSWRSENRNLTELQYVQSRNSPSTAKEIRDQFCHYFNTSGAVHWQDNMI